MSTPPPIEEGARRLVGEEETARRLVGEEEAARRLITEEVGTDVVVTAGAGTGKTTALVERIVQLVRTGTAPLRAIAAIAATEEAATQLRERVRRAVTTAAARSPENPLLATACNEMDESTICTLGAFAERILRPHCIAAGLPLGFAVLDDTADRVAFDARWLRFLDALFEDPDAETALTLGFCAGLRHTDLAAVAWELHQQWDRLDDGGLERLRTARPGAGRWPPTDVGRLVEALDRAVGCGRWCTDDDDNLAVHLRETVGGARDVLAAAGDDTNAVLQLLVSLPPLRHPYGKQENWSGHIAEVRSACAQAERARDDLLTGVRRAVLDDLLLRLADFTLVAAEERRAEGRLTPRDLLVHTRRLLRQGGETACVLRRHYRGFLVDDLSDTDPLSVEVAALLAAPGDEHVGAGEGRCGALVVLRHPARSAYRVVRPDITLCHGVDPLAGTRIHLRNNVRSVAGIVAFVNVVFGALPSDGLVAGHGAYDDLLGARPAASTTNKVVERAPGAHQLTLPGLWEDAGRDRHLDVPSPRPDEAPSAPVVVVGGAMDASLPEVSRRAARDAARAVHQVVQRRWLVEDVDGSRRVVRWGDVAVLIPTRAAAATVEEALEEADVPYRVEDATLLWSSQEVRDVLAVLHAADDPADPVAVLAALRTPGFACGDDDLVEWAQAGGTWDPGADGPAGLDGHVVGRCLATLHELHRQRWWSEPSAMVVSACDVSHAFALALTHRRPRDHWRRLRWLVDQSRLFDETVGGTLREFLVWAGQRSGDRPEAGAGTPDPDDDAVRVMTVHAAQGREFPVVVIAGLEPTPPSGGPAASVVWDEDNIPDVQVGDFRTAGFDEARDLENGRGVREQHRLVYVAMTRARDHMVLCLHHRARSSAASTSLAALVMRLCAEHPRLWRRLPTDIVGATCDTGRHDGTCQRR